MSSSFPFFGGGGGGGSGSGTASDNNTPIIVQGQHVAPVVVSTANKVTGGGGGSGGFANALDGDNAVGGGYVRHEDHQQQQLRPARIYDNNNNNYGGGNVGNSGNGRIGNSGNGGPPGGRNNGGCRDVVWAVLFYIHLFIMIGLAIMFAPQMVSNFAELDTYDAEHNNRQLLPAASSTVSYKEEEEEEEEEQRYISSSLWSSSLLTTTRARLSSSSFSAVTATTHDNDEDNMYTLSSSSSSVLMASERYLAEDNDNNNNNNNNASINPGILFSVMCLSGILGFVLSTMALGFMINFAETLVKAALIFNVVLFALVAIWSLLSMDIMMSIWFMLMFAMAAYYAYIVWQRIPFAAANLVTATTAVRANIGLAFYSYMSLIILFLWSVLWSITSLSTISVISGCDGDGQCDTEINLIVLFLLFFSYYWTSEVITNVVVVTTAGTVGTWWYTPMEANTCCSKGIFNSYIRSITTSFGSICLGSLIVALIQAIKAVVHSLRENGDSLTLCIVECIIGCIENLVEYFNKWAYIYVGLYGYSFMEAGQNVINLFKSRGWTSIITDSMVDTVLFMVSIGVGFITAILGVLVGGAAAIAGVGEDSMYTVLASFVLSFIIGYSLCSTLLSVVSSATNTVIVCYADAPAEFQQNHPQLSTRMRNVWKNEYPNEFQY